MKLFGKKAKKKEEEPEPKPRLLFAVPTPAVYLRELRQPLYDTEWCVRGSGHNPVHLFMRPMAQPNMRGDTKTDIDTNMVMCGQLPTPIQFDWWTWRTEFSPNVSIDLIRNFRFCSRLDFQFGERIWFSVPLSYIPFSAFAGIEELRQAVSVLVVEDKNKFEAAWEKARIVKPKDIENLTDEFRKQNRHEIYRTELARNVCSQRGRPWRIKPAESFVCRLLTNWDAPFALPDEIAVRLYLEGYLYRAV